MKLRCAYCKHVVDEEKAPSSCPKCGKPIVLPESLREHSSQDKSDAPKRKSLSERLMHDDHPSLLSRIDKRAWIIIVLAVLLVICVVWIKLPALRRGAARYQTEVIATKQVEGAQRDTMTIRGGLAGFFRDCGRYPTKEESIGVLIRNPGMTNWRGPYVKALAPDPWGNSYKYTCENGTGIVFSAGPDMIEHTADDIIAPEISVDMEGKFTVYEKVP